MSMFYNEYVPLLKIEADYLPKINTQCYGTWNKKILSTRGILASVVHISTCSCGFMHTCM